MVVKKVKQVAAIGVLGFVLVGCASTPEVEDTTVATTASSAQTSTGAASGVAGVAGESVGSTDSAAAQRAVEQAKEQAQAQAVDLREKRVHFDFDRSEVKPEFFYIIKAHADFLSANPAASVTVEGHCDERGTREYNLALGDRRANAVKNALIAQGVQPGRINVISFGEDRPLLTESNNAAWDLNRRAEFIYNVQ